MNNSIDKINSDIAKIEEMRITLKSEFFGIDCVIDKICDLLIPWYALNNNQIIPTTINLWSMTGHGKTSLVARIKEILDVGIVILDTLNVNEYDLKDLFPTRLSNKRIIILIDDIHNDPAFNKKGENIYYSINSFIWKMLSDGIVRPGGHSCIDGRVSTLRRKIDHYISSRESNKDKYNFSYKNSRKECRFWTISETELEDIVSLYKLDIDIEEYKIKLQSDFVNTLSEILFMIDDSVSEKDYYTCDVSKSCIFICGNLHGVYSNSYMIRPDADADEIHNSSLKIKLQDIKDELKSLFTLEQISRLGNNHIIYPAFSKSDYINIINKKLNDISASIKKEFKINIVYDKSLVDIIYTEGVYPTQGARPVISTINSIINPAISKFIIDNVDAIYRNNKIIASYHDNAINFKNRKIDCSVPIRLSISNVIKPQYDNKSVRTAVHEAGHATTAFIHGLQPYKVNCFDIGGYCKGETAWKNNISFTKKMIIYYIETYLSGHIAENIIFGKDNTVAGCSIDLSYATHYACQMFTKYGMGKDDISFIRKSDGTENYEKIDITDDINNEIKRFMNEASIRTENLLKENIPFLLDIAKNMLNKPYLNEEDIKSISEKHGVESEKLSNETDQFEQLLKDNGI